MLSVDEIEAYARECLGTPWKHQGRLPGHGLDCVGLVRWPMVASGLWSGDYRRYYASPAPSMMEQIMNTYFDPVEGPPQPGNILWMRGETGDPYHLAILTSRGTLIHAVIDGPSRVVEHAFRFPFTSRVHKVFKYRDNYEGVE